MARDVVLGNGKIVVGLDSGMNIRDLYYPHVGQLNHVGGNRNSIGVWVDGHFSWMDEEDWNITMKYREDSLVCEAEAVNESLSITCFITDAVHYRDNLFLRDITCIDAIGNRDIRFFFTHDFSIDETEVGDTAAYEPSVDAVFHYKRNRYILTSGGTEEGGIFEYTTGVKRFHHLEGTWKDAEDGHLEGHGISQGSVDSTFSVRVQTTACGSYSVSYWMAVGHSFPEVKRLHNIVQTQNVKRLIETIHIYWIQWTQKGNQDFCDLPKEFIQAYKRSLLIIQTHCDVGGAILAAIDSDILAYNRDHYCYMWPRDGALVALALSRAGCYQLAVRFFTFCDAALTQGGYLLHKYNPDGSVGSSWHPFVLKGTSQLPIQEDETALVLYALWEHFQIYKDIEFVKELYPTLICRASDFLVSYRIPELRLPQPSYDLWEERRGVYTYTTATVITGIQAAAKFSEVFGESERADALQQVADELKSGLITHLYDQDAGRFARGIQIDDSGSIQKDMTLESSLYGLFAFNVLPASDAQLVSTMDAVWEGLRIKTPIEGIARYTNDYYFSRGIGNPDVPGNPWVICTLWSIDWLIETAKTIEDLQCVKQRLHWVLDHSLQTGVLPEQIDPYTGEALSVAPLTWSHSTFILTVLRYCEKYRQLMNGTKN